MQQPGKYWQKYDSSGKWLPAVFVTDNSSTLLLYGFSIPILFIIILRSKFDFIPSWLADTAASLIGPVLPLLGNYYSQMMIHGQVRDAEIYAAFFTTLILFFIVVHILVLRKYLAERNNVGISGVFHIGFFLSIGICSYLVSPHFDFYSSPTTPYGAMYFDSYGIFYIKQYFVLSGIFLSTLVFMISFLSAVNRFFGSQTEKR